MNLPGLENITTDNLFTENGVSLSVLRLDKIHPVVSGNKLFKLHYFIEEAVLSSHKTIITFGGAYSNHLIATAFACNTNGLKSIGIVRGEKSAQLSSTLQQCIEYGMKLKFISRAEYDKKEKADLLSILQNEFGNSIIIPEGGYHPLGVKGAALMMDLIKGKNYTHICTATGTATSLAGLLTATDENQQLIAVNVLKGMNDTEERILHLTKRQFPKKQLEILPDYHFGGYAKKTDELIAFMNQIWQQYRLPTDFVYTAKMLFAVFDKIKNNHFPIKSNILCLHTGGLQGNCSLPVGTLNF